jgi:hypothetical protein
MLKDVQFYGSGIAVITNHCCSSKSEKGQEREAGNVRDKKEQKVSLTHARLWMNVDPQTCLIQQQPSRIQQLNKHMHARDT